MMTDLRYLMAIYVHAHRTGSSVPPHIDAEARAALADEPAVPIPPAALPEGYIDPEHSGDDRALLQTFYSACQAEGGTADEVTLQGLRAVLARWGNHVPAPPADGEVADVVRWLKARAGIPASPDFPAVAAYLTRAAELLQRQVLVPVSVSERLPGPSDCAPWPKDSDASAWCWVGTDQDDGWNWEQRSAGCLAMFPDDFTHWLPAHALPLPEVGE